MKLPRARCPRCGRIEDPYKTWIFEGKGHVRTRGHLFHCDPSKGGCRKYWRRFKAVEKV